MGPINVSKPQTDPESHLSDHQPGDHLPEKRRGFRLLRKVVLYHVSLALLLLVAAMAIPGFMEQIPVGGVEELAASGDLSVSRMDDPTMPAEDFEIVETLIQTTSQFDRLGYARKLILAIGGVWLLMLPISWVHKGIHRVSTYDHSLDETTLILPGVVAAIVLVVQHSLALAFDALFILVAIGTGIAAGVEALEIAAVLTVFFCYATLYVYYVGDGLESHHEAQRKERKRLRKLRKKARKAAEAQQQDG